MSELRVIVVYRGNYVNARGDIYGQSEPKVGHLLGFAEDFNIVVVESAHGEILRIPYQNALLMGEDKE
jgi:hypothetical protein